MDEKIYAHSLKLIPQIGILRLEKLYGAFSSFEKIWRAGAGEIFKKTNDKELAEILSQREKHDPRKEYDKLKKQGIELIIIGDKVYPALLKEISHPPLSLYCLGNAKVLKNFDYFVAVVGTRRATSYGRETAKNLARDLSLEGIAVVSGLALGIDGEAHRGALEGKTPTIAVLGSGLGKIYPAYHKGLADKIIEKHGLIISEYPPQSPPAKWTFPERNRIIAGLSQAIIVIESPKKGGSLITANFALDANREVGAVPGEISSINSEGTNRLIKTGAALIRGAEDVLELLGLELKKKEELDNLSQTEQYIINLLKEPKTREELMKENNLSSQELNQTLTLLELKGLVENKMGMFYKVSNS